MGVGGDKPWDGAEDTASNYPVLAGLRNKPFVTLAELLSRVPTVVCFWR